MCLLSPGLLIISLDRRQFVQQGDTLSAVAVNNSGTSLGMICLLCTPLQWRSKTIFTGGDRPGPLLTQGCPGKLYIFFIILRKVAVDLCF